MHGFTKSFARSRSRLVAAAALLAAALLAPGVALAQDGDFACADQAQVSPALIAQAQQRVSAADGISLADALSSDSVFPSGETLGLSTTGKARVVVIRVSFPASEDGTEEAQTIPEYETDDELLGMFNAEQDSENPCYPYESLHAYYERSSLGKLDIKATQVVDYTAKYPRSHYEAADGDNELFVEAAEGVDGSVDFSECDANNDGYIDAVYLQFAGKVGEWGSRWWPQKSTLSEDSDYGQRTFDGKRIHAKVLISTMEGGSYDVTGERTVIIHETGHVLGLPDLYSQASDKGPGVGTFDMMDTNAGDQNGLFKWLLGWVTTDDITFVRVTSSGIYVRQGSGEVVRYDDAATLDLSAYTSDTTAETGGFIAISTDESILSGNLFCSFYLLQFDHAAGNQAVTYNGQLLGHGVRAFRVQAGLNDDQTNFKKNNTFGVKDNQLFEVLDPTEGGAQYEYGAFMHKGQVVSPTTTPSSNFRGSQQTGYSGITFEIVDETDASAQVKVSWTAKSAEGEFALTPSTSNRAVNGSNNLSFSTSWLALNNSACKDDVYLLIDGEKYVVADNYDERVGTLDITLRLNPGVVSADSAVQLVVPAGYFDLGLDNQGNETYSDEIRLDLDVAELQKIVASGTYESTATGNVNSRQYSDVVCDPDGNGYFFQATYGPNDGDGTLQLVCLSADGSEAAVTNVDTSAVAQAVAGAKMQVVDLGDGTAYLHSIPYDTSSQGHDAWIDLSSGEVLATYESGSLGDNVSVCSLNGNATLVITLSNGSAMAVVLERSGSAITCSYVLLPSAGERSVDVCGDAGENYVWAACAGQNVAPDCEGLLMLHGADDVLAAGDGGSTQASVSFKLANNYKVYDVKVKGDKVYVAAATIDPSTDSLKQQVLVYSMDGQLEGATDVSAISTDSAKIKVSDNGSVAWACDVTELQALAGGYTTGQVILVDGATNEVTELGVQGVPAGAWLGSSWLEVSPCVGEKQGGVQHMRWSLTVAIGEGAQPAPSPDPDPTPDPDPDPAPAADDDADQPDSALPQTGDATNALPLALLAGGVAALVARWRLV
jgi:M6 family metalloprotease-like protein